MDADRVIGFTGPVRLGGAHGVVMQARDVVRLPAAAAADLLKIPRACDLTPCPVKAPYGNVTPRATVARYSEFKWQKPPA